MTLPAVPLAGLLGSPPVLVGVLLVLLLAVVVGRTLLALTWRLTLVALCVVLALWVLGAVGLGPL